MSATPIKASEIDAELQRLWLGVVREQAGEEVWRALIALYKACSEWRGSSSDGGVVEQIEFFEHCEPSLRSKVMRAARLAAALTDFAYRLGPTLERLEAEITGVPLELARDEQTGMPLDWSRWTLEHAAEALKRAGLRPLPARPYPPYPQLQVVLADPDGFYVQPQVRCLSRLAELWVQRLSQRLSAAKRAKVVTKCRAELLLLWQSDESPSAFGPGLKRQLRVWLSAFNDHVAGVLHIDPRFANFVPFVKPWAKEDYDDGTSRAELLKRLCGNEECGAHSAVLMRLMELGERLTQHSDHTLFGPRMEALRVRLSTENPALAVQEEANSPGQTAKQVIAYIQQKVENNLLGRGERRSPRYAAATQLLLDLKHLHQAVAETYGGVAFAPEVREILMTVGLYRFHGRPVELLLEPGQVEKAALEVGRAAGLCSTDTYASPEEVTGLLSAPGRLAGVLDAGALTAPTRELIGLLRAARWAIDELDPDSIGALILDSRGGPDRGDSPPFAELLALMRAVDHEAGTSGHTLCGRVSICAAWGDVRLLEERTGTNPRGRLWQFGPWREWLDERGGHLENVSACVGGVSFGLDWAVREHDVADAAYYARLGRLLTLTDIPGDWDLPARLATFPRGCLKQHVRIDMLAHEEQGIFLHELIAKSWLEATLASLTLTSYLESDVVPGAGGEATAVRFAAGKSLSVLDEARAERGPLAQIASMADAFAVAPDDEKDWRPLLRCWDFGSALADVLDGKTDVQPDDIRREAKGWPFLRWQIAAARRDLAKADIRLLALTAWYRLPKGKYGEIFPAIEAGWHRAKKALDELSAGLPENWDSRLEQVLAKRPHTDAMTLLSLAGEPL